MFTKNNYLKIVTAMIYTMTIQFQSIAQAEESALKTEDQISLSQYWMTHRKSYNLSSIRLIDSWMLAHKTQPVIQYKLNKINSSSQSQAYRMSVALDQKTYFLELFLADDVKFKKNNKTVSDADFLKTESINFFDQDDVKNDRFLLSKTSSKLETSVFNKMSSVERSHYLVQLRFVYLSAQNILRADSNSEKTKSFSLFYLWPYIFGVRSYAVSRDRSLCIDKYGFQSHVNPKGECELQKEQHSTYKCSEGSSLCNPQVYALNRKDAQSPICVTAQQKRDQISCEDLSPIKSASDIKSYMASMQIVNQDAQVSENIDSIDDYIKKAMLVCESHQSKMSQQCQELMQRKMALNSYIYETESSQQGQSDKMAQRGQQRPPPDSFRRNDSAQERPDQSNLSMTTYRNYNQSSSDCGFICSATGWLTSDTAIKTYLTAGGFLMGYLIAKNKYKNTNLSSTSNAATGYSMPTYQYLNNPTTADYSGVAN